MTGPGHCEQVDADDGRTNRAAAVARDRAFETDEVAGSRRGWRDCLPRLRELDGGDIGLDPNDGRATVPGGFVATGRLLGMLLIWAGQQSVLIGVLLDEPRGPRGAALACSLPAPVAGYRA
ncbi:hypothetical protein OL229_14825 [Neisseriaceae bacterium JH1-16]|nr:hypothetical protein [Neisseriaceae bacterium JH1-16]